MKSTRPSHCTVFPGYAQKSSRAFTVRTIYNSLTLPHLHPQLPPQPGEFKLFAVRKHVLFFFCIYSVRPKISWATLTSSSLTGPQKPNHKFSCFCQMSPTQWVRHPTWVVPLLTPPASFPLVLNLMDITSLSAVKLFKQANHILPREPGVTLPSG